MKKRLLITIPLLCVALCANAAVCYMTVALKSGEKFSFLLKDNPVVTYKAGELVVNGSASTSYAISGVENYHFTEADETDVTDIGADMLRIVNTDDNTVVVENAPASENIALVNAIGTTVVTTIAGQSGFASIMLPSAKGVYVLTVGKQSFKLIRK